MMTFSLSPRSRSTAPVIAASVNTRVVSWNEAAEMNESVDSEALVIPSSSGRPVAGWTHLETRPALRVLSLEAEAIDLFADQESRCRRRPRP